MEKVYDLGIIGAGPAGYSAAIKAAQNGLSVILFEKEAMGGVCLNKGCIPTKTILHCSDLYKNLKKSEKFGLNTGEISYDYQKIFERKNEVVQKLQKSLTKLVQSHGVEICFSNAVICPKNRIKTGTDICECKNIIICTGAKPVQIKGLETDGKFILNSDDVLNLSELPENILIAGSGAIGVEWARIFSALDKNVTVIELADRLLPAADIDISKRIERLFKKNKIKYYTSCKAENIKEHTVTLSNGQTQDFDMILCAAGREAVLPQTEGIDFDYDGKFLKVNENFQTNIENIFAIGDVNGKMQLAHSAVHQAIGVVDFILKGVPVHFCKEKVPSVIYGNPEIAWVGKTEEMLQGQDYKVSIFPVAALGKALADDEIDGTVKVLSADDKIAGAHIVCPGASSLIHQFALMIDNNLKTKDILNTVFAHPTYSEAVFESILGLEGLSLSLPFEK